MVARGEFTAQTGKKKHSHHSNAIPQDTPDAEVIPGEHRCRQAGSKQRQEDSDVYNGPICLHINKHPNL